MKVIIGIWLMLTIPLLACDQSQTLETVPQSPAFQSSTNEMFLYLSIDDDGAGQHVLKEIVITDSNNNEPQRITLPAGMLWNEYSLFPIPNSGHAWLTRNDDSRLRGREDTRTFLINTHEGKLHDFSNEIPGTTIHRRSVEEQHSGDNTEWDLLIDHMNNVSLLIELNTNDIYDLNKMLGGVSLFGGIFTPDDSHILADGDGEYWIIPTDDITASRRLGEDGHVIYACLSGDGQEVAYIRRMPETGNEIIIEDMAGSEPEIVATYDTCPENMVFIPGQDQLLIAQNGVLHALSLSNRSEETWGTYENTPYLCASSGGEMLLFGDLQTYHGPAPSNKWQLINVQTGQKRDLPELTGYGCENYNGYNRWVIFLNTRNNLYGDDGFYSLDLESGKTSHFKLPEEIRDSIAPEGNLVYGAYTSGFSSDGEYGLILFLLTGDGNYDPLQLWIINSNTGETSFLLSGDYITGTISPDGHRIALNEITSSNEGIDTSITMMDITSHDGFKIAQGISPIWLSH